MSRVHRETAAVEATARETTTATANATASVTNAMRAEKWSNHQHNQQEYDRRKRKLSRKSPCVSLVLFLSCLCGNVYQITKISSIYFAYPMNTQVSVGYPSLIDPPSQTICFYLLEIFDWPKVIKSQPEALAILGLHDETNHSRIIAHVKTLDYYAKLSATSMMIRDLNVSSILSLTIAFEQIFQQVNIFDPLKQIETLKTKEILKEFKIHYFLRTIHKCFMFQQVNPRIFPVIKINRMFTIPGFLYQIRLRDSTNDRTTNVLLAYSPQGQLPRSGFYRFIKVNTEYKLFSMTYQQYENQFLPPPFETKCISYSSDTIHKSRADCFDDCVIRSGFTYDDLEGKVVPGPLLTQSMASDIPLSPSDFVFKPKLWSLVAKIEDQCASDCHRIDCNSVVYVPVLQSVMDRKETSFITFSLSVPATNTTFSQKVSFTEYATDLVSTFGFWLGISLFSTLSFLYRVVNKVTHVSLRNKKSIQSECNGKERKNAVTTTTTTTRTDRTSSLDATGRMNVESEDKNEQKVIQQVNERERKRGKERLSHSFTRSGQFDASNSNETSSSVVQMSVESNCSAAESASFMSDSPSPGPGMLFYRRKSSILPEPDLMRLMVSSLRAFECHVDAPCSSNATSRKTSVK